MRWSAIDHLNRLIDGGVITGYTAVLAPRRWATRSSRSSG